MYAGRIVEDAAAESVFREPHHPYTRALAGAFPHIGDSTGRYAPSGLPGDPPLPGDAPERVHVPPPLRPRQADCRTTEPVLHALGRARVSCFHPRHEAS